MIHSLSPQACQVLLVWSLSSSKTSEWWLREAFFTGCNFLLSQSIAMSNSALQMSLGEWSDRWDERKNSAFQYTRCVRGSKGTLELAHRTYGRKSTSERRKEQVLVYLSCSRLLNTRTHSWFTRQLECVCERGEHFCCLLSSSQSKSSSVESEKKVRGENHHSTNWWKCEEQLLLPLPNVSHSAGVTGVAEKKRA